MIYLDHAATTYPRQPKVMERMLSRFKEMGCSPGRGGYDLAVEAEACVQEVRQRLAAFFGAPEPERVVFCANATEALNLAIFGLVRPGGHVISTRLEHNSVIRPLHHLEQTGRIQSTLVGFDADGVVDPEDIARAVRADTCLVIVNHASNVLGSIQPVAEIGRICAEREIPFLVDTAQTAGYVPIDMSAWKISAMAFTGHKALLGPTGIGGLVTASGLDIRPTRFGGTGLESQNPDQPDSFPHRLETGTLNVLGIMGLQFGLEYLEEVGLYENYQQKLGLVKRLGQELRAMNRVRVYGSPSVKGQVPILSCNIAGMHPSDVGMILDGDHDIAVRTGLHCAPLVHEDLGTAPAGAVRFSLGWDTRPQDIERAVEAIASMTGMS